jgi:DNA-binding transcriptional LysR family regulator
MAGSLERLRTFLSVYRSGSLTAAARRLHMSQPAISKHLHALETERGRALFIRGARGVTPTQDGHALAREVGPHLDALEGVAGAHAEEAQAPIVHFGGPPDLLAIKVLPTLAPLVAGGAIRLRCLTGVAEPVLDHLAEGALDLAIASRPLRRAGIRIEPLFEESLVLVGNAAWAARLPASVIDADPAAALAGVPLVAFDEELPLLRRYWREVLDSELDAAAAAVLPDLRGVVRAVSAGAGVTVVPRYLAEDALRRGELRELHVPPALPRNPIGLAYRPPALRRAGVGAVRERLRRAARAWN